MKIIKLGRWNWEILARKKKRKKRKVMIKFRIKRLVKLKKRRRNNKYRGKTRSTEKPHIEVNLFILKRVDKVKELNKIRLGTPK